MFTPMPKMALPPGVVSTRMPASLRPLASMSLGHRTIGSTAGASVATDSASATPQASDQIAGGAGMASPSTGGSALASTTTLKARLPGACHQRAPRCPRPSDCMSATTTAGRGQAASSASSRARSIVEPIAAWCSNVATPAQAMSRAGSIGSGGGGVDSEGITHKEDAVQAIRASMGLWRGSGASLGWPGLDPPAARAVPPRLRRGRLRRCVLNRRQKTRTECRRLCAQSCFSS